MRKIRFTIVGLMTLVLAVAVAFAAVRNADPTWSGVLALLTYGTLGVAILGIVFRSGAERAWWFGYFLFGWGYLRLAPWAFSHADGSPTRLLLLWIRRKSGSPPTPAGPFAASDLVLSQIDRCLWAIPAALLGGLLVRLLFVSSRVGPDRPRAAVPEPARPAWKLAIMPVGIGLAGLVLMRLMMVLWWTSDPGLWAGGTYLVTCGLLGIATLGALLGGGDPGRSGSAPPCSAWATSTWRWSPISLRSMTRRSCIRERPTNSSTPYARSCRRRSAGPPRRTNASSRRWSGRSRCGSRRGRRWTNCSSTSRKRRQPPVSRVSPSTLTRSASRKPSAHFNSTVRIDIEGHPLKATLRLCLRQLGLSYMVKDGHLWISGDDEVVEPEGEVSFRIVGHSLLALLAAGVGGVLAPLISALSRERPGRVGDTPPIGRSAEDRAGSSSES